MFHHIKLDSQLGIEVRVRCGTEIPHQENDRLSHRGDS